MFFDNLTASSTPHSRESLETRAQTLAYDSAFRHTRRVRFLRWFLPLLSLLFGLWIILTTLIANFGAELNFHSLRLTGEGLVMQNPQISGQAGTRSYQMTAAQAIQRIAVPSLVELEHITARLQDKESGLWIALTARSGQYDVKQEHLRLNGDVFVESHQGTTLQFQEVEMDLKTGTLNAPSSVTIASEDTTLKAGKMSVEREGQSIRFQGGVRTRFLPTPSVVPTAPPPGSETSASSPLLPSNLSSGSPAS